MWNLLKIITAYGLVGQTSRDNGCHVSSSGASWCQPHGGPAKLIGHENSSGFLTASSRNDETIESSRICSGISIGTAQSWIGDCHQSGSGKLEILRGLCGCPANFASIGFSPSENSICKACLKCFLEDFIFLLKMPFVSSFHNFS